MNKYEKKLVLEQATERLLDACRKLEEAKKLMAEIGVELNAHPLDHKMLGVAKGRSEVEYILEKEFKHQMAGSLVEETTVNGFTYYSFGGDLDGTKQ